MINCILQDELILLEDESLYCYPVFGYIVLIRYVGPVSDSKVTTTMVEKECAFVISDLFYEAR